MALSPNTISKMQRFLSGSRPETPDPQDTGILGGSQPISTGILDTTANSAGNGEPGTTQPTTATNNPTSPYTGANTFGPNGPFAGETVTPPVPTTNAAPPVVTYDGPSANTAPGYTSTGILSTPPPPSTTPSGPVPPVTPAATTPASTTPPTGINTVAGTSNSTNTQLNESQLTKREVDPNELVRNQLTGILGENSEFITNEEAAAQRAANVRGLSNSTMAASAGREAAIKAAMPIATADASTYGKVADYNTALNNQAYMYNVDAENNFKKLGLQIGADKDMQEKAIAAQLQSAGISAAASMNSASANLEAARISAETSRLNAQLNAQTSTGNQESQNRTSIYNQKLSLANNIMQNADFSPDYKRSLLNGLGPEFALLATNVFMDGSMDADLNGTN